MRNLLSFNWGISLSQVYIASATPDSESQMSHARGLEVSSNTPLILNMNAIHTQATTTLSSRSAPVCGSSQSQCAHMPSQRPANFPTSSAAPQPRRV